MPRTWMVTQTDQYGFVQHSKIYHSRWRAHFSAWLHAGKNPFNGDRYRTEVFEVV